MQLNLTSNRGISLASKPHTTIRSWNRGSEAPLSAPNSSLLSLPTIYQKKKTEAFPANQTKTRTGKPPLPINRTKSNQNPPAMKKQKNTVLRNSFWDEEAVLLFQNCRPSFPSRERKAVWYETVGFVCNCKNVGLWERYGGERGVIIGAGKRFYEGNRRFFGS